MALTLQNADPHKPIVTLGQAYFAYEARRRKLVDMIALSSRPEDLKRDVMRFLLYTYDLKLQKAAQETRAVEPGDFAIFYDNMYAGLRK